MSFDGDAWRGDARRGLGGWSFVAVVLLAAVGLYVWKGTDGLLYPYYLVRSSFIHANAWALDHHGPWLRRLFYVLEGLALVWFVVVMLLGAASASSERYGAAFMLAAFVVACAPLVPFVWVLVNDFGFLSPQEAAFIVRNAR